MTTILVIDDEFGIAATLEAIFGEEGYRVVTANNGRQALLRLAEAEAPPDLILLNYMMPLLDGPGVLRALRAEPAFQNIPVVMMTALPESAITEDCAGYAAFLRKPFKGTEALKIITRILGGATITE